MNNKVRRFAALQSICLALIAASATGAMAADFHDTENHWAAQAIDIWSDNAVIHGHEGAFRPDDTVTRGELAVMLDRIMKYTETAENTYSDLGDTWYTEAVLKLAASGIIEGDGSVIRPEDSVTREEAAVMFARAFELKPADESELNFTDASDISDWALDAVLALSERGFVNGFEDGTFRPGTSMSRAEFVTMVNNAVTGFYTDAGTYTAEDKLTGIVVVNAADVVLNEMEIDGDIILAPGVGDGVVTLVNCTVTGDIITQGGSVVEENDSITGGEAGDDETPTSSPSPTQKPGGSGGGGGGGSSISTAAETSIIVNKSYADRTGTVTVDRKRYTIGKNAFASLNEAIDKANSLEKAATITLKSDLTADETIVITADGMTLDGGGRKIEFAEGIKDGIQAENASGTTINSLDIVMNGAEGWSGSYGIQVYLADAKLSDISVTGADAALLVNGSEVTLSGDMDVSGNEFGGIEVSKGSGVETMPKLMGDAKLVNSTETASNPTVWIDKVSELTEAVVELEGLESVDVTEKDQKHYFVNGLPETMTAEAATAEELKDAVSDPEVRVITVTGEITADEKLSIGRSVTIKGGSAARESGAGIVFDNTDGIEIENAGEVILEDLTVKVENNEEGWQGIYGIQAYGTSNVTLNNVTVTGADGGVLVNGAEAVLSGVVDVSGNEFGGIEVSKGVGVETMPKLSGDATLRNDSESASNPTIWIDKVSGLTADVVAIDGLESVDVTEKDQKHYFVNGLPETMTAEAATAEELKDAVSDPEVRVITVTGEITADEKLSIGRSVTIKGGSAARESGAGIVFDNTDGIEIENAGEVILEDLTVKVENNEEGWQGIYGIQAYGTSNVTLNNVTVTGADGGVLVNGAEAVLSGVVDVSGNEFGGIEVSKGSGVETTPNLKGAAENLKNDSESLSNPTIWIDKVSELTDSVVEIAGLNKSQPAEKDQMYFFIGEVSAE